MKKLLILVSVSWSTGEINYSEDRLVVVESEEAEAQQSIRDKATAKVMAWFPSEHPESELLSIIAKDTTN